MLSTGLSEIHIRGVPESSLIHPALAGFVLAGGKSRRMGKDKAELKWDDHRTLLEHMVYLLSTAAAPVRIVGRKELPDTVSNCGPLGGILTALDVSSSPANLIVAVDLPSLTPEFLSWFAARVTSSSQQLVTCQIGGDFPLCLGVHRGLKDRIAARIHAGELALHRWIRDSDPEIVSEDEIQSAGFPLSIFLNVNTPYDWKVLRDSLGGPTKL